MTYEELLKQMIEEDDRIVVMTAENRASIRNIPEQIKNNFVDVGIAEMSLVGSACGMALRGRIPVVHALAAFLTMRSFEFIRTDVGYGNLPVKLVGAFSGFLGTANGPTHQAVEDVGLMYGIPNVGVFCPADKDEMLAGLPDIIRSEMPFYIRYNDSNSGIKHHEVFRIAKAEVFGEGNNVAILTYGILTKQALEAKTLLDNDGISTRLINLRTVKPFDRSAVNSALDSCRLIVTVEDHFNWNGLYSILANYMAEQQKMRPVLPLGLNSWHRPGMIQGILEYEGFTGEKLAEKIKAKLKELNQEG